MKAILCLSPILCRILLLVALVGNDAHLEAASAASSLSLNKHDNMAAAATLENRGQLRGGSSTRTNLKNGATTTKDDGNDQSRENDSKHRPFETGEDHHDNKNDVVVAGAAADITERQVRELLFHAEETNPAVTLRVIVEFRKCDDDKCKHRYNAAMAATPRLNHHFFNSTFGRSSSSLSSVSVVMDVTPHALAELIRDDPNIARVEFDSESYLIAPIVDNDDDNGGPSRGRRHRHLDQEPPTPPTQTPTSAPTREPLDWVTWGLTAIQADQVVPLPDPNLIKVCVVDTGYDNGHVDLPELDTNKDGFSSIGTQQNWFQDVNGHGTHVTGTIAALKNARGIVGVFPNVSLFIAKGIKDNGKRVSTSNLMEAVESCIDNGARVVSMSFKTDTPVKIYSDVFEQAYQDQHNSILFVAAAGNDGDDSYSYPASYPAVMSVGAVDSDNNKANFSQYNDQVDISAPGVGLWSTVPETVEGNGNGYAKWSGTSVATPHVAGVAALVWSHNPTCTAQQIRRILLASALSLQDATGGASSDSCDVHYGRGLVQAKAAVDMLEQGGCEAADGLPLLDADGLSSNGTCFDSYPIAT